MKKPLKSDPDIVGLMTRIQEQLAALDKKVEALIQRSLPQPMEMRLPLKPSFQQPVHAHVQGSERPNDHRKERVMYRATCADCKKECELPFKPSGDRPVYCKECFSRRKSSNTLKVATDHRPKALPSVPAVINAAVSIPESPAKEQKKPAAARKSAGKKKLVSPKKKK